MSKGIFNFGEKIDINQLHEENKKFDIIAVSGLIALSSLLETIDIKDYKKKIKNYEIDEDYGDGFIIEENKLVLATGKKRPDLACADMEGKTITTRPYLDELAGITEDDEKTFEELLNEAENGDEDAIQEVIEAYQGLSIYEIEENPEKELFWMEKLADLGNVETKFEVAKHYVKGYAGKKDLAKAEQLFKEVIEESKDYLDNAEEIIKFADRVSNIIKNEGKAKNGDIEAQKILATEHMSLGVSLEEEASGINFKTSFDLAKKLVEQKEKEGFWILALAYEHGRGTRKNRKKAVELYEKGAELGHAGCQHSLACYYLRADYLEKDLEKAEALLIKSNEQGYELAPLSLFSIYAYEKDFEEEAVKKAIEIGEKVANEGNVEMQYELAKFYTTQLEEGKMLDATRSRYWYAKAALDGNYIARMALDFETMWEGQEYEDDEELMKEIKETFGSDEENYEDEDYDDDAGSLGFIPIVTNEKGEKHVDFFSLRLAGREDEYEELEAKLQEMLKNENE